MNPFTTITATDAQTNFGPHEYSPYPTLDTDVVVSVTFLSGQTTKVGSAYSTDGEVDAGETIIINDTGKSWSGGEIIIAAQTADAVNGVTISAGDIVTLEVIDRKNTEACFRADRLIAVNADSDYSLELIFLPHTNSTTTNDTIIIAFPYSEGVTFREISELIYQYANANLGKGGVVTLVDDVNPENSVLKNIEGCYIEMAS